MNKLAFNGMVVCIYHGRGNKYIKALGNGFTISHVIVLLSACCVLF
jgi:hypothetical protein